MVGHRPNRQKLGVERLGVALAGGAGALHRALDHPDVEPNLLLQRGDLVLAGAAQPLHRMAGHGVMHASDEPRDAHHPLKVDPDHVERRRILAVPLHELQRELVGEGGLAGVARPEQRHVRLRLQRESDVVGEALHADDLGRIVQRAIPDERVQRSCHADQCTADAYKSVPSRRYAVS